MNDYLKVKNRKALWLTDLHFERMSEHEVRQQLLLYESLDYSECIITGDIGTSESFPEHLARIAKACSPRNVYFVLGNHDFYGTSINAANSAATNLANKIKNLHHLHENGPVLLDSETVLIGHHGWADGRAGWGCQSDVRNPDNWCIDDFRCSPRCHRFTLMNQLGSNATSSIRRDVFRCPSGIHRILIATHVPAFASSCHYDGAPCGPWHLPYYVNYSLGGLLIAAARKRRMQQLLVLSGHTHSPIVDTVIPNLESRVGSPREVQIVEF